MKKISKPPITEHALYYEQYIEKLPASTHVLNTLKEQAKTIEQKLLSLTHLQLTTPYADGKWSIQDIIMHLIDMERVFMYRAMRIARNDKTPLPFFDENEFAKEANANALAIKKLLKEYKTQRQASLAFFQNLNATILKRAGIASNATMSVRACAWIICSHELHHWAIINERYLK